MNLPEEILNKIIGREQLPHQEKLASGRTGTVVFTNGCFDILHPGHVHLLHAARQLGDILVVGLNTDDSVRRLKGPGRPVTGERSRAVMLAALSFVDYVILFSEDTPLELIRELSPDILVKGGDYQTEDIVGHDLVHSTGGKTITIPLLKGFSSSSVIDKSKKA